MRENRAGWIALIATCALLAGASTAQADDYIEQRFPDQASFLGAFGLSGPTEDFEGFESGDCLDGSVISSMTLSGCSNGVSGVTFSSPGADFADYERIEVACTEGVEVCTNKALEGGIEIDYPTLGRFGPLRNPVRKRPVGETPDIVDLQFNGFDSSPGPSPTPGPAGEFPFRLPQIIDMDFAEPTSAFAMTVLGLGEIGESEGGPVFIEGAVLVEVHLMGEGCFLADTFELRSAGAPVFFGIQTEFPICGIRVRESSIDEAAEGGGSGGGGSVSFGSAYSIDDLIFLGPPDCQRIVDEVVDPTVVDGTAMVFFPDTISSVALTGNANGNLTLMSDPPGSSMVGFSVTYDDMSGLPGQGAVVVTDDDGETCKIEVDFREVQIPFEGQLLCDDESHLFELHEIDSAMAGISGCSIDPFDPDDPDLPPGYEQFPTCDVLTIIGPFSGNSEVVLKVAGDFNPDLRLMFSRLEMGDFSDFQDVTTGVAKIAILQVDPTRLSGIPQWSEVKVTCATLDIDCEEIDFPLDGSAALGASIDADMDGFALCDGSGNNIDCNDQIAAIHPGATEICNGMDDNCDGTVDEGFFTGDTDSIPDCFDNCPTIDNENQFDTDSDGFGDACDPSNINTSVTVGAVTTFYFPPGSMGGMGATCPSGVFQVSAPFTNSSTDTFVAMSYEVAILTGGNTVVGATGGTPEGGPGSFLLIPPTDLGPDGVLSPGESFMTPISVCLTSLAPFDLFVNVQGVPVP